MSRREKNSTGFHQYFLEQLENAEIDISYEKIRTRCNAAWNNLTKDKREEYRLKAEAIGIKNVENKIQEKIKKFADFQKSQKRKEALENEEIKKYLDNTFQSSNWNSQIFIIAHANYRLKFNNNFYIIEIGLLKYSLDEGLIDHLEFKLNSGCLPLGNAQTALFWSETTHKLPVNDKNFGLDLEEAREKVKKFLGTGIDPFIFTLNNGENINVLKSDAFMQILNQEYLIVPLEKLFTKYNFELNNIKLSNDEGRKILSEENPWENWNIGCKIHYDMDNSTYCSLAIVKRWGYHISKLVLPRELLFPGNHVIPLEY